MYLKYISLCGCIFLSDASIYKIANVIKNLKYLDISICDKITDNSINELCKKQLNIEYLNMEYTNIGKEAIDSIIKYSNKLKYLNVNYCYKIKYLNLNTLKHRCKKVLCNK